MGEIDLTDHTTIPEGSVVTVEYDERYSDPGPDGAQTFVGTLTDSVPSGFDFVPLDGPEEPWSIMAGELDRGVCKIVKVVTPAQRTITVTDLGPIEQPTVETSNILRVVREMAL